MELRQLVYFEAVVRCGGFTRAAESLNIAQPAVSAQVRRLERELGTTLLERTTRRVALTHAGELLLVRARKVLAEVDGVKADLDDLAVVLRGHLRLGVTQILGPIDLSELLATFHRRYPELRLTVRTGLIATLLDELDDGTVDLVLGPVHPDLPHKFIAQTLATEDLVLITPPGRQIAKSASLGAYRDEPFVCLPASSGLHAILLAAAEREGFEPRVQFEVPDPSSIRGLVAAGLGVALLAESAARIVGPPITVHRLKPSPPHPPIGLIRVRDRRVTPSVRAWQQHLAETLSAHAPAEGASSG
jgi:LysR family transcriptional activator of glutamate synthase operon